MDTNTVMASIIRFTTLALLAVAPACTKETVAPFTPPAATEDTSQSSTSPKINLDAGTLALIAKAERVAFIIPFSHWDTDWHDSFPNYVKRSDGNILNAIQMAKADPRFRYTLEQVYFVQHFWGAYPEHRADLKAAIERGQITFAWAGLTQPETSLVAPAVQVRNLQLGQDWITETFGPDFVPRTAWQSDAFGNSAAFPIVLTAHDIPYLFIGRWQHRCDPDYDDCAPLPHLFYWRSPAADSSVLVAYLSYPNAWDAIHRLPDEVEQVSALRAYVEEQFARTDSKYAFIPMGSDFIDPLPNVVSLVDRWNAADQKTILVIADPATAFRHIASQPLPEVTVDLNPIWQAFYNTRPFAKIADKESEYFLTAADKFGLLLNSTPSTAWETAAVNAHYDNVGAVSFDWVWDSTQRPRFEQAVSTAADDLSATLTQIANGIESPLIIFNPTSWARSEVIEINGGLDLPGAQRLAANTIAIRADSVPAIGWTARGDGLGRPPAQTAKAVMAANDGAVTLSNGLVSVTLDPAHGGAFSNLSISGLPNLLSTYGDDITYWEDDGDVYGASFGDEIARESRTTATITVLAEGPLLARARVNFTLGGQPITKTVTLRADSPLIEVRLDLRALPGSSVIAHTPTTLETETRTDDLGFAAFTHEVDNSPIVPGDVTYRRKIFYPFTYWSDVSANGASLALITHGLQGLGGAGSLNLLLVRSVSGDYESVTDLDDHTLHYAYLPHLAGQIDDLLHMAYAFNQPLIPVWRLDEQINVQLPFNIIRRFPAVPSAASFPATFSLASAESGLIADLYRRGDHVEALILDYDPATPATLQLGDQHLTLPGNAISLLPVELTLPK